MNVMTATPSRRVAVSLVRTYRPVAVVTGAVTGAVTVLAAVTLDGNIHFYGTTAGPGESGSWLAVAGLVSKWWLFVVGIQLVNVDLQTYVAGGVTRRAYLTGAAAFGTAAAVVLAVGVVLGGLAENVLAHAVRVGGWGSALTGAEALTELGNRLPISLAYLAAGALFSAGFYRLRTWAGALLAVPALVPLVVAETLLGITDRGGAETPPMSYPAALLTILTLLALAYAAARWLLLDAPIRYRAAG